MLNESDIIQRLTLHFPRHIGDDAACLPFNDEQCYVISKDVLVENRHFRLTYQDAKSLAHKALHVNLSDIAAMGATPQFVLLGLSIPLSFEPHLDAFLEGVSAAAKAASVLLIGGDTTGSSHDLLVSVTAIGIANKHHLKLRSTAKPHDLLFVTGKLGHAHLGFTALEHHIPGLIDYKDAFLNPNACLKEGLWFGQQRAITGMMDVSDGLWIDVERMCNASHCGAELCLDSYAPSTDFIQTARKLNLNPRDVTLIGGEDYGLLVATSPDEADSIAVDFKQTFGYELTCVGKLTKASGIKLIENGKVCDETPTPFSHF